MRKQKKFLEETKYRDLTDYNVTFKDVYNEWLEFRRNKFKQTTFYAFKTRIKKHIITFLEKYKLHYIKINDVLKWRDNILNINITLQQRNRIITDLKEIFDLAELVKANPKKYTNALDGKVITTLFFEPSTRTRLSFESAIQRLGAKLISTENAKSNSSSTKGELLEDSIRVISGYSDAIIMRHSYNDAAERAAKLSTVPIINAGSGKGEHPTQSLLDAYTIRSKKGRLDNLKIAILGDLIQGRTIHSLINLFSLYENIEFYALSMKHLELPEKYVKIIENKGKLTTKSKGACALNIGKLNIII